MSNCSSSADQRILDISLQSDCPIEVDFDVSQLAGSSSQSRDLEFDTAAKRRDQGIITTTSTNSSHSGVLHGLLQQDLIQSKNQRDRLLGIVADKGDKTTNSGGSRASSKATTDILTTHLRSPLLTTVDHSECKELILDVDHEISQNRSIVVSVPNLTVSPVIVDSSRKVQSHSAEHQRNSKGQPDTTLSNFTDVMYKSSSIRDSDKHTALSDLNSDDDYAYSHGYTSSRPLPVVKYSSGSNSNVGRAAESSSIAKNNRNSPNDGFRADDVWGSSRSNTMLSYVVSLSEVMLGSGYGYGYGYEDDENSAEMDRDRVGSGVDNICGGYVSDDRCFVGAEQYKWSNAWNSRDRDRDRDRSKGSCRDQPTALPSWRDGVSINLKNAKRSAATQGQVQSYLYGDRDRDRDRDREREMICDAENNDVTSDSSSTDAGPPVATVSLAPRAPLVLRLEPGERKKVTVIFRPAVDTANTDSDKGALVSKAMNVTLTWLAARPAPPTADPASETGRVVGKNASASTFIFSDGNTSLEESEDINSNSSSGGGREGREGPSRSIECGSEAGPDKTALEGDSSDRDYGRNGLTSLGVNYYGMPSQAADPAHLEYGYGQIFVSGMGTDDRSVQGVRSDAHPAGGLVSGFISEVRVLTCTARVCESIVSVTPAVNDLGECSVGDFKVASFAVTNHSDLPALLLPYVESETLAVAVKDSELRIAKRESRQIQVEYVARVENTEYRRSCFLFNVFNRKNSLTMEVRAKNVDTHDVLLHSKYYQIVTYNNRHQVQIFMDKCVFSRPNLRIFSVKNIHSEPLELEIMPKSLPQNHRQNGLPGKDLPANPQRDVQLFRVCCRSSAGTGTGTATCNAAGCDVASVDPPEWASYYDSRSTILPQPPPSAVQRSRIEQLKWHGAASPKTSAYMLDTLLSPGSGTGSGTSSAQQLPTSIAVANFVDTVRRGGDGVSLKECISSLTVSTGTNDRIHPNLQINVPVRSSALSRGQDSQDLPLSQQHFVSLMTRTGFPVSLFIEEGISCPPSAPLSAVSNTLVNSESTGQVEIGRNDNGITRGRKGKEAEDGMNERERERQGADSAGNPCSETDQAVGDTAASDLLSASASAAAAVSDSKAPVVYCNGQVLIDRLKLLKRTYQAINTELANIKDNYDTNNTRNISMNTNMNTSSNLQCLVGDKSGGGWDGGRIFVPAGCTVDLAVVFQPTMTPVGSVQNPAVSGSGSAGDPLSLEEEITLTRHLQVRLLSFSAPSPSPSPFPPHSVSNCDVDPVKSSVAVGVSHKDDDKSTEKEKEKEKEGVVHEVEVDGLASENILSLLKPRSLYLRAKAARSEMVLLQRNINFGKIIIGESASGVTHGLTIVNKSRLLPLAYNISKSGSYASGALRIPSGRKGLIAPLSSQIVVFVFKPTLPGLFEETLLIENIMEPLDRHSVIIKAKVSKMETFTLFCDTPTVPLNQILNPHASSLFIVTTAGAGGVPYETGATSPSSSIGEAMVTPRSHISKCSSRDDIEFATDRDRDREKDRDKAAALKEIFKERERERESERERATAAVTQVPTISLGSLAVGEQCETVILFRIRNETLKARTFIVDATHADAVQCITPAVPFSRSLLSQHNRGLPSINQFNSRDGDCESVQSTASASSFSIAPPSSSLMQQDSRFAFELVPEVLQSVVQLRCRFEQIQTEREKREEQSQMAQQKMGDQLEFFQQKLKIALRKKKPDKIEKYQSKIKDLLLSLGGTVGTGGDRKVDVKSCLLNESEDDKKEKEKLADRDDKDVEAHTAEERGEREGGGEEEDGGEVEGVNSRDMSVRFDDKESDEHGIEDEGEVDDTVRDKIGSVDKDYSEGNEKKKKKDKDKEKDTLNGMDKENKGKDKDKDKDKENDSSRADIENTTFKLGVNVVSDSDVTLHLALGPGEEASVQVLITLLPGTCYKHWGGSLPFKGYLRVFECRNEDVVKTISFHAMVFPSRRALLAASAPPLISTSTSSSTQASSSLSSVGVGAGAVALSSNAMPGRSFLSNGIPTLLRDIDCDEETLGALREGSERPGLADLSTMSRESDDADDSVVCYYGRRAGMRSDAILQSLPLPLSLSAVSDLRTTSSSTDQVWTSASVGAGGQYFFPPIQSQNYISSNGSPRISRSWCEGTGAGAGAGAVYRDDMNSKNNLCLDPNMIMNSTCDNSSRNNSNSNNSNSSNNGYGYGFAYGNNGGISGSSSSSSSGSMGVVDISSVCLITVAQWSSYPTKQIFPHYRDKQIEVLLSQGQGSGQGQGLGLGQGSVQGQGLGQGQGQSGVGDTATVKTRLLGMAVKLVQATKDRVMEGVLSIASLTPFPPTPLSPMSPPRFQSALLPSFLLDRDRDRDRGRERAASSPFPAASELRVRILIEEFFEWKSVISTLTFTHENIQTKVTPYCSVTHGPIILVPALATSQGSDAATPLALTDDQFGPILVTVIPICGKLDCRVQWKPLQELREELMVVVMLRVEVEIPSTNSWTTPQYVPVVSFLEHRSRFKVDRLLNFGDVALGSSKSASATLRIKVSHIVDKGRDSNMIGAGETIISEIGTGVGTGTGTGVGTGHCPLGDFHYVAMLVPPSASSKVVGSLVIASGQNGVLASSYSSTKSIDLLFSACGSTMGRFEQELWIVSLADRLDQKRICCTATVVPSQSQFVDFPDLKYDTVTGKLQQLELGLIQIQSAAAGWGPVNPGNTGLYPSNRKARSNYHCIKSSIGASTSFFSLPLTTATATAATPSSSTHSVSFSSENSPDVTAGDTSVGGGVGVGQKALYNHKLRVVNVSSKRLLVTAVSNLKSQCFLYADEQCTVPVLDTPLPSRPLPTSVLSAADADNVATLVVYVVIRPSALLSLPSSSSSALDKAKDGAQIALNASDGDLLSASSTSTSLSAVGRGHVALKSSSIPSRALSGRELVGGIRLLFFEAPSLSPLPPPLPYTAAETSPIPFASAVTTDRESEQNSVLPIAAPRKLFESTVVFRAIVGQSVLKAKVLTPRLSLHPHPTPHPHHHPAAHAHPHPATDPHPHPTTHAHPHPTQHPDQHPTPHFHQHPHLHLSSPQVTHTPLIAVGHITLTNASPTFPLHYRYPQCSPHTKQRLICLPSIGLVGDDEIRDYVLSSLAGESNIDGDGDGDRDRFRVRERDVSVSTLVLLCPQHHPEDASLKDNVILPDRTITLPYAIIAPLLPSTSSGTGTGIGVGTLGSFEGICVHDLDILNTHTREVTSLVVSALFHIGELTISASHSTSTSPSHAHSHSHSHSPSHTTSASSSSSSPSSALSSEININTALPVPVPVPVPPCTPVISVLGDISSSSAVLALKCTRSLRVSRSSKQQQQQQKVSSDEPSSHVTGSSGTNSSNTHFTIIDPIHEGSTQPQHQSLPDFQDALALSSLTLHAAHNSSSGNNSTTSSSSSSSSGSRDVDALYSEQGHGTVKYLRVLPVSNLPIRVSSEGSNRDKVKDMEKEKDRERDKDKDKGSSAILRQTSRDVEREKEGEREKDKGRDSRISQEPHIGQSVGGGLRVCGEALLVPLGSCMSVQIHCYSDKADAADRVILVKGSGLASVLSHCFNLSPLSPKPIKALSVKGIIGFMLLPDLVCTDPGPVSSGSEGNKVCTSDTYTALTLQDPSSAVNASSIKNIFLGSDTVSSTTIECGQVKRDGQKGEEIETEKVKGKEKIKEKEKEKGLTPSSSSALLSMFDRSPPHRDIDIDLHPAMDRDKDRDRDADYGASESMRFTTSADRGNSILGALDIDSDLGTGIGTGLVTGIGKDDGRVVECAAPMLRPRPRGLSAQATELLISTLGDTTSSQACIHPLDRSQSQSHSHLRPLMPPTLSPRPSTLSTALPSSTLCTSPVSTSTAVQIKPLCTGGSHGIPLISCCTLTLDLHMDGSSQEHNTPHSFSHTSSTSHTYSHTSTLGSGNGTGGGVGSGAESNSKIKSIATSTHKKITSFADLSLAFMQS